MARQQLCAAGWSPWAWARLDPRARLGEAAVLQPPVTRVPRPGEAASEPPLAQLMLGWGGPHGKPQAPWKPPSSSPSGPACSLLLGK